MLSGELLGLIGGTFVTCSYIPQIIRIVRLKSAYEISVLFTALLLTGILFWLSYGIYLKLLSVILWNAVGAICVATLLWAKLKYGRSPKPEDAAHNQHN